MNYTKHLFITLLIPCFLQAGKENNKHETLSNCAGLFTVGLCSSFEKIGRYPIGPITKIVGIVPSFFVGKKTFQFAMNIPCEIKNLIKTYQK